MEYKFRSTFGENVFYKKYADRGDSWPCMAQRVVEDVCGTRGGATNALMSKEDRRDLTQMITQMKFIPGGRYLHYAGKPAKYYNNCYCLKAEEDTREEWANISYRAMSCLMTGGGIGVDYSILRPSGRRLRRTGGVASGPIPLMRAINELGRNVEQGGSRRSACWAGLNWTHDDIYDFLTAKDWSEDIIKMKAKDFNFPAPLDMTNISILWDTEFIQGVLADDELPQLWYDSVQQMCKTGEPGHCYNFWGEEDETLRNACTEFISDRDSDVCNLGSINFSRIDSIEELADVVDLASKFLVCGTLRADLPYDRAYEVRKDYRKIGLGLMGVHEWLILRGYSYEPNEELRRWLEVWKTVSEAAAKAHAERFYISPPTAYRAVAPAGSISILAGTTSGIEPVYHTAFKRRYLENGRWKHEYVIDWGAQRLMELTGYGEEDIETALTLAKTPERRLEFQAFIQDFTDMGISYTINLPEWGSEYNNEDTAREFANTLLTYCTELRGITVYPNGSRGGQPLTPVSIEEAHKHQGIVYDETDMQCVSGVCGI